MKDFSYITNSSPAFIEGMYQEFVRDPASVDPEFRKFFEGFDFAVGQGKATNGHGPAVQEGQRPTITEGIDWQKELNAYRLILGYGIKAI